MSLLRRRSTWQEGQGARFGADAVVIAMDELEQGRSALGELCVTAPFRARQHRAECLSRRSGCRRTDCRGRGVLETDTGTRLREVGYDGRWPRYSNSART